MKKEKRVYSPLETFTKLKAYEIRFNEKKKEQFLFEYDVYSLIKVINFFQHILVFDKQVDYERLIEIYEQSGVSKEVFEMFDLSEKLSKKK